jgi:hypothetical protein
MNQRITVTLAALTLLLGSSTSIALAKQAPPPGAQSTASSGPTLSTARSVVTAYFRELNAAMKTGDFSQIAALYGPNGTLTSSSGTAGTASYRGRAAIVAAYRAAFVASPGGIWTQGSVRSLTSTMLLIHARWTNGAVSRGGLGVFIVKHGMIAGLDWVTY